MFVLECRIGTDTYPPESVKSYSKIKESNNTSLHHWYHGRRSKHWDINQTSPVFRKQTIDRYAVIMKTHWVEKYTQLWNSTLKVKYPFLSTPGLSYMHLSATSVVANRTDPLFLCKPTAPGSVDALVWIGLFCLIAGYKHKNCNLTTGQSKRSMLKQLCSITALASSHFRHLFVDFP